MNFMKNKHMKWYLELIIWVTLYTLVFGVATPLLIQKNTPSALLSLLFIITITISITILKVVKITVSIKKDLDEIKPKDR